MSSKASPYYPNKKLTYGNLYFFIKTKTFNVNPFDKESIKEGRVLIFKEAREASPTFKMFIKAAKLATGLSEKTITTILYTKEST